MGTSREKRAVVIALLLAGMMPLLPVLPRLHHATSLHNHVYCLDHRRIEDVPRQKTEAVYQPWTSDDRDGISKSRMFHVDKDRPACLISNLAVQSPFALSETGIASFVPNTSDGDQPLKRTVRSIPTLFEAPKHSPPVLL